MTEVIEKKYLLATNSEEIPTAIVKNGETFKAPIGGNL
jgi:hypothetical protein